MTTRSYTDGDDVPAQPAVRSAWDVVKKEARLFALNVVTTCLFATSGMIEAALRHWLTGICSGIAAVLFGFVSFSRAAKSIGILKKVPAPKPCA